MKKIILLIIIVVPMFAYSNTNKDGKKIEPKDLQFIYKPEALTYNLKVDDEIQHLRYCIGKYRKEKVTGIWLTIGGAFTAGLATGLYQAEVIDETTASIVYIGGGVSVITGYVMQLTCNRWLKKAAIGPADSGIGVKVSF